VGDRAHLSRPGLLAGPGDPSGRLGYWPARFARDNGPAIAPDAPGAMVQFADVRDYARWLLDGAERRVVGTFNAVGEPTPFTTFLGAAIDAAGYSGHLLVADAQRLADHGVGYWAGPVSLPLWLPAGMDGFSTRSAAAAEALGFAGRSFDETLEDVLADERRRGLDRERPAGLGRDEERALVEEWTRQG
jgi:hypothetical protein